MQLRDIKPVASATAGTIMPAWLRELLAKKAEARRVAASAAAYRIASGGRVDTSRALRGRGLAAAAPTVSLDEINAALLDAAEDSFLASRSEAAFCQAGVVAPPDSLTDETSSDSGEGF